MKEQERKIWEVHRLRLAAIKYEETKLWKDYYQKQDAIKAAFGKEKIPYNTQAMLNEEASTITKYIGDKNQKEMIRYEQEMEQYKYQVKLEAFKNNGMEAAEKQPEDKTLQRQKAFEAMKEKQKERERDRDRDL